MSCGGAGAAEDEEAVDAPLGVFDAVGGEVGEPVAVGEVSELVEAVGEVELGAPPAAAQLLHGGLAFAPGVEGSDDADGLDVATEEAELDLAGWQHGDHDWLLNKWYDRYIWNIGQKGRLVNGITFIVGGESNNGAWNADKETPGNDE